jgi:hypothetical protein
MGLKVHRLFRVDFECHYHFSDEQALSLTMARIIPRDDPVLAKVETLVAYARIDIEKPCRKATLRRG